MEISFFDEGMSAGFPSQGEDFLEKKLDLNEYLIKHPAATFFIRVEGDSMIGAGIYSNDILVVDRAEKPESGRIVVALYNGEFTVKRLIIDKKKITLQAAHPSYSALHIKEGEEFQVWGVVSFVIHKV